MIYSRLLLASIAAVAATAAPGVAAQGIVPASPPADGTILDVTAQGIATRTPDIATIRAGVVTDGATATAAIAANAQRMTAVLAALRRAGITDRDVQTASFSLSPHYRYEDGKAPVLTGYQASNSVAIKFRDITRAGAILDTLVGQGANQIDGPALSIDQPDAALDEARTDAVRRARARAELYARAAGLSVARILSISESGTIEPPVMPMPLAYARAKADSTPIAAGTTDLAATISVRFLLR